MNGCAILLVSSFAVLSIVSAHKRDILVNTAREKWISSGSLRTLIQVSLNVSICCNVQISGQSPGTENLFNEFVKLYPYEYIINNRTFDCDGYFMISGSVDNLVTDIENAPTRIATTELLIILDDNVGNSTQLFNASMYENSNVNIAALDGLWTLSDNFKKPRVFEEHARHSEMIHKRGIVNLGGRELQCGTRHQPPLCYLQTTVNRTVDGIKAEIFVPKNESEIDGVEMKLFMLIAERLNFTWTLRQPNQRYKYGNQNKTRWSGGLIGLLFENQVDVAFSSLWLKEDSYHFANMTVPWSYIEWQFLVPRPKSYLSVWALIEPLSPEVWLAVLVVFIIQSAYVYTSSWISSRISRRFRSFTITATELLGRLLGTWAPSNMQGLRIQFQLWHIMSILVITAYSSSLAARLTNPKFDARIDSMRDFVEANLTWGRRDDTVNLSKLIGYNDPYAIKLPELYQRELSESDRHERISRGNYAIVGFTVGSYFFPEEYVQREDYEHLRVMKNPVFSFNTIFAVQPWLLEPVNEVLSRLIDGGIVHYHIQDVLHRRTTTELREVMIEHDGQTKAPRVLKLIPLAVAFTVLISGIVISSVVFCIEFYTASRKKPAR